MNYKKNIINTKFGEFQIFTLKNDAVGYDIISGKIWEPHIINFLSKNLTHDDVFLDIGSNYGWHVLNTYKKCKKIYSFEPQTILYEIQKDNLQLNDIQNVEIFNIALGEENKDSSMSGINYESNGVNMGDLSIGGGGEKIKMKTLDSLNLNFVNFIKLDVQGYEKFVILGGMETIKKFKPTLIVEFEDFQLNRFGYGVSELFNLIKELGYYPFFLDYSYPSDHVFIHDDNLNEFKLKNKDHIFKLESSNYLNSNLENGVSEKLVFI